MRSHHVSSQSISSLASFHTVGTLVCETREVRLNVLLHCVPKLAREVALGALPDGFTNHWVVGGDKQLRHLQIQI